MLKTERTDEASVKIGAHATLATIGETKYLEARTQNRVFWPAKIFEADTFLQPVTYKIRTDLFSELNQQTINYVYTWKNEIEQ